MRGRWLTLARTTWLAVVLAAAVILLSGGPVYYSALHKVPGEARALADLGLPIGFHATYVLARDVGEDLLDKQQK